MHNHKNDHNYLQNEKEPKLPANRTVWKSDNQGFKEEIFIQVGRRGRGGELERRGRSVAMAVVRKWQQRLAKQAVPHSHVVNKN